MVGNGGRSPRYEAAVEVIRVLRAAGHRTLLAGGCVRDRLLGEEPKDYDVATSARPAEVIELFDRTEPIGAQFGVVLVLIGAVSIEVATFRSDGDYQDGRRPESIQFSSPEADAARRDFTINAMFLDPETDEVIDYVGGQEDLKNGVLRTVGEARERFQEDRLRMLRAARFAARFSLTVDPAIRTAIRELAPCIQEVANERITDELVHMAVGPTPDRALFLLDDFGLLPHVLPGVRAGAEHLDGLRRLPARRSLAVGLAALFHGCEGERLAAILDRLRLSRAVRRAVEGVQELSARLPIFPELDRARQKRLVRADLFPDALMLSAAMAGEATAEARAVQAARQTSERWNTEDLFPPLFLDGEGILALGVPVGPEVGRLLWILENEALEGRVKSMDDAKRVVNENR